MIATFKKQFINENPNKDYPYTIDIYTKWRGNYLYFCEMNKDESPDRIKDQFETMFVRLTYKGRDRFDFYFYRHTGTWSPVAPDMKLQDCLDMIRDVPTFQPLG